jgi:hypothetical protein
LHLAIPEEPGEDKLSPMTTDHRKELHSAIILIDTKICCRVIVEGYLRWWFFVERNHTVEDVQEDFGRQLADVADPFRAGPIEMGFGRHLVEFTRELDVRGRVRR